MYLPELSLLQLTSHKPEKCHRYICDNNSPLLLNPVLHSYHHGGVGGDADVNVDGKVDEESEDVHWQVLITFHPSHPQSSGGKDNHEDDSLNDHNNKTSMSWWI